MPEDSRGVRGRLAALLGVQSGSRIGPSYVLRTTSAAIASLLVCRLLHIANPIWAIVSSVVVILPEHSASIASAALRATANLAGAGVGVAIGALSLPQIPSLLVGLVLIAGVCRLLAIDAAARTASVAVVIVLLKDPRGVLGSSELRVVLVLLGCAIALVVTIAAAWIERALTRALERRRQDKE